MTIRPFTLFALIAVVLIVILLWLANLVGLLAVESQHGYYAPVWGSDGESIYYFERRSRGLIVGPGWEHFSPPAKVFLLADRVSLVHHDLATGRQAHLHSFDIEPHLRRWTNRYHNRIFGWLSTVIEPGSSTLEFKVSMSIPRVPRSETWVYRGTWNDRQLSTAGWAQDYAGSMASSDLVLLHGSELMTIMNPESYGAAVLSVRADNSFDVLLASEDFSIEMVTERQLSDRSRRAQIEKVQRFEQVQAQLVLRHRNAGLSEGDATLEAYDEMETMGLLARSPRIIARKIQKKPEGEPIFRIPGDYFAVGLFKDIAAAIEIPGIEIKASTGDHLKYYDDDVGPRLKAYRGDGNQSFVVETEGVLYRITLQ